MSRKHRLLGAVLASIVLSSLLVSFLPGSVAQAWSTDPTVNTPVCTVPRYQDCPVMVSDGSGGAIIAWQDGRSSSYDWDIYAQRLSSAGIPQWTDNGTAVYAGAGNQWLPAIADDGSGGAIIAWNDSRTGTGGVYAQRVNSAGVLQWTATGIALCNSVNYAHSPLAVRDGSGGAVVVWVDWCYSGSPAWQGSQRSCYLATIYAQRVNSAGQPQWAANGVVACTMVAGQEYPYPSVAVAGDGAGGVIITWQDFRSSNWDIYAQRVNSAGVPQWTNDGIAVSTAPGKDWFPAVVSDGSSGAIVAWSVQQSDSICDIRGQRLNSAGTRQWGDDGTTICSAVYEVSRPVAVSDGAAGAIIAWANPYQNGTYGWSHIYAQRVNASGATQWAGGSVPVCTYACDQFRPVAISDRLGGAIIAWHDDRSHYPPPPGWSGPEVYDIYAQRVDSMGTTLWADNGAAVCRSAQRRSPPALATDGSGAVIIAWNDQRTSGYENEHIYAQRVAASGELGGPSNQAPAAPSNVSPTGTGVNLTPTLQSSVFSDPDAGDTHAASQWRIRTSAGSYSSPVYDSGSTASNLTSVAVPPGMLTYSVTYYWHVRHQDNHGAWSSWSTETSFTSAASPNHPPAQPANVAPTDATSIANLAPTLSSSAFSDPDAGDTQAASQWQVRGSTGNYSSPDFDSGTDTANLTSITISSGVLDYSSTYHWHVRHQDNHAAWSEWSTETSFTTPPPPIPDDATPPSALADLATTSATANSVTLTWTSPGDDGSVGMASAYDIRYSTATITDGGWTSASQCSGEPLPQAAGTAQTFTVTDLSPDTTYHFAIKTADEVPNWSGLSNSASRRTEAPYTLPPSVTTSAATSIGTSSATLNGDLASLGTADNVWVCFEWGLTDSYGSTTTLQGPMWSPGTWSYPLSGLTPGTTYHFRAKADGGDGTAYGSDMTFTTGQTPEVEDVDPDSGRRNQDLTVTILGAHLDGATAVSFGSGITVEDFTVDSSTEITAEITVDADATLGGRDVSVTTEWGTATKTGAFSVVGGGGGICGSGAPTMPGQGGEMMTMLAALGLLFGVGYVLVMKGMRNKGDSVQA